MKLAVSILCLAALSLSGGVFPDKSWQTASPKDSGLSSEKLDQARKYAQTGGGAGMIVYQGKVVKSWGSVSFVRSDRGDRQHGGHR